ncbi:unnamed protein product [Cylindrotheca closterium]|uniref:Uncharacterized protein n=1 Tax=Cylindrotheca closterium TaxID=2856 RepID=A0AAD2D1H0_9STRA|nr:unnamed protein product [Cylindrotheca closterium]
MAQNKIFYSAKLDENMQRSAYFKTNRQFFFAVKTKAYAAIASTNTAAQNKFKDDIFEAVLAIRFLHNCNQRRTASLMLDLQTNYCREVDYYPKTVSKAQDMLKIHMEVSKNPGVNLYQRKRRLLPKIQWKNQDHYVDYGKKVNLNQIGATIPATVPAIVPGTSASTSGESSVAGSVNTPLQLAGTTGNQMMQAPLEMQLMQIPTQVGGTVTVPYSMDANGEIAFSGMQLGHQGMLKCAKDLMLIKLKLRRL